RAQPYLRSKPKGLTRFPAWQAPLSQLEMQMPRKRLVNSTMVVSGPRWFRPVSHVELFWASFQFLPYKALAGAAWTPMLPELAEQSDRARSHPIRLHLSFRPWLARSSPDAERNAPARLQRDKSRLPRRASRDMKSLLRSESFRIRRARPPSIPSLVQIDSSR